MHRLRAEIAAMRAELGGLDAFVFTGGVRERSAPVREQACDGLGFVGRAARCEGQRPRIRGRGRDRA